MSVGEEGQNLCQKGNKGRILVIRGRRAESLSEGEKGRILVIRGRRVNSLLAGEERQNLS